MTMSELENYRNVFRNEEAPRVPATARAQAVAAAMAHHAKILEASQGSGVLPRLRKQIITIWNRRTPMQTIKLTRPLMTGASLAALAVLVVTNPAIRDVMNDTAFAPPSEPAQLAPPAAPKADELSNLRQRGQLRVDERASPQNGEIQALAEPPQALIPSVANPANNGSALLPTIECCRDRFTDIHANPVKQAAVEPLSTFSIDVDTSSYSFLRRALIENRLPPRDAVRVEEMINYFPYDYQSPDDRAVPFKANVNVIQTPWNPATKLLRIGIRGFSIGDDVHPRSNLVFLVDTSGSMQAPDKLPLLVNSFKLLLATLSPEDTVSIVTYAGGAGTALEPTKVAEKGKILAALDALSAGGSTAGAEGIRQAYELAERNFDQSGVNRVILATDGDFNVGISDPRELEDFVAQKRQTGIYLSVLGFGQGNYNDELMQALAQNGNGNAAYIDSLSEARKVMVNEATSTLFPIANDVKIQVEFNPATISEYRLIGYETRLLNQEDFNNDRVDAGDIGAGHTVTALYEITPKGSEAQRIDLLRYGAKAAPETPKAEAQAGEYAFVKIRYKLPGQTESRLITQPVTKADERPSTETNFAAAVAAFGQILRGGEFTGSFSMDNVISLALTNRGPDEFGYRSEFINLVRLAKLAPAQP
jgi:Ca-activated chloride channel family protein